MRLLMHCPHCEPGDESFPAEVPPKNDCVYQLKCPKGHIFDVNVLVHRFERLFRTALSALIDEYYRESIGSFAASYERFIELFVRVVMNARDVDKGSTAQSWKSISRQSERQLGAFTMLYTLQFRRPPERFPDDLVQLRNKVVHQGYYPDREECLSYGEAVLKCIRTALDAISESRELRSELDRSINDQEASSKEGPRYTYLAYSLIGTNRAPDQDRKSLAEMLKSYERARSL